MAVTAKQNSKDVRQLPKHREAALSAAKELVVDSFHKADGFGEGDRVWLKVTLRRLFGESRGFSTTFNDAGKLIILRTH